MNINNIGGYYPYGDYSHNNSAYSDVSGNSSYGVINSSYTNGAYNDFGNSAYTNSAYSGSLFIQCSNSTGLSNLPSFIPSKVKEFINFVYESVMDTYESIIKSKFGYKNKQVTYTSGDITIGVGKVSNTYNNFSNIFKPKTEDGWGFTINWNF